MKKEEKKTQTTPAKTKKTPAKTTPKAKAKTPVKKAPKTTSAQTVKPVAASKRTDVNPEFTDAFIQEVNEDVKNDNFKEIWKKYGI